MFLEKKVEDMTEFIDLVREFDGATSMRDFKSYGLAEKYINATFIMLLRYISLGELEDVRSELPKDLKSMVYHKIMF